MRHTLFSSRIFRLRRDLGQPALRIDILSIPVPSPTNNFTNGVATEMEGYTSFS
jgi:hypothetical protein